MATGKRPGKPRRPTPARVLGRVVRQAPETDARVRGRVVDEPMPAGAAVRGRIIREDGGRPENAG